MTDDLAALVNGYLAAPFPAGPERARFVWARDVRAEQVSWLWADRIPRGAVTILAGDPGLGKSVLTCELAARVSRGQALPGGPAGEPETVLMLTAEDALGAVVRPRLEAAGADLSRVALDDLSAAGDEPLTLPSGMAPLGAWMLQHRPALVVIDPVVAFLDGGLNAHKDSDVRRALRPLAELAEEAGAAVVVVMHFNKGQGSQPLYRLSGSIGFAGAARSLLVLGRRPDGEITDPTRLVAVAKSSYAQIAPSVELAMSVRPGAAHPSIGWRGEVAGMTAEDLLRPGADAEERSEVGGCADALVDLLRQSPRNGDEARSELRRQGFTSDKTIRNARERIGVTRKGGTVFQEGFRGPYMWRLPEPSTTGALPPGAPVGDPAEGHPWENPVAMRDPGTSDPPPDSTGALHTDMGHPWAEVPSGEPPDDPSPGDVYEPPNDDADDPSPEGADEPSPGDAAPSSDDNEPSPWGGPCERVDSDEGPRYGSADDPT